jgi:hypothetical protein
MKKPRKPPVIDPRLVLTMFGVVFLLVLVGLTAVTLFG